MVGMGGVILGEIGYFEWLFCCACDSGEDGAGGWAGVLSGEILV